MAEIVLGIRGDGSPDSRLDLVNSLHRYSGVLEVDLSRDGDELRVRYEPYNIRADDIRETVEEAGYRVGFLKQ